MPAVSSLVSNPQVRKTLDWLIAHTDDVIADAVTICEIPAPTFHELERAAWVADQFRRLGLTEVEIDAVGNVYGLRPGHKTFTPSLSQRERVRTQEEGEGALMLAAHTDTVFPLG